MRSVEGFDLRDWYLNAWRSVVRTVYRAADFDGRSRAVDVVYYWLAAMVAALLISWPTGFLPWDMEWFAERGIDVLLGLPIFALFARRLHDQGFSAWWTLALVPFPAINLYQSYRVVFAVRNPSWLYESDPLDAWSAWLLAAMLVVLVLFLRPGARGPNRYGPDPRDTASA